MTRVLDLFAGQGGAARGYAAAGFEVTGIDLHPMPRYPYEIHQWDALNALKRLMQGYMIGGRHLDDFDLIHASPPCQYYSHATRNADRNRHPDLIPAVQERLRATGKPYVIENVPGAPLQDPLVLCGCMFGLHTVISGQRFHVRRPRLFETGGFTARQPRCRHVPGEPVLPVLGHGVPGWFYRKHGHGVPAGVIAQAMHVPWMTREGVREAIPPVFTGYIAEQFTVPLSLR